MKRIVICCDGTWNSPEKQHVTNVARTARAVLPADRDGVPQVVFYDWGVGSDGRKVAGGMLGAGIDKNIQDAYRFLVHNYVRGDQIYLFGFSRGAYTVRSLAGFVRKAGLLRKIEAHRIPDAFRLYRRRGKPDSETARAFRAAHAREIRITFVGVWDTVGALGIPSRILRAITRNRRYAFHDTSLSDVIRHACHAVAIDEKRIDFRPTLWKRPPGSRQTIEQQWFAGVHGDVGGGYAETGLSDIALTWIWSRAATRGLALSRAYARRHVRPDPLGKLHRSWTGMFRAKGRHYRPIGELPPGLESIHPSVRERYERLDGYRPKKLVELLEANPEAAWQTARAARVE